MTNKRFLISAISLLAVLSVLTSCFNTESDYERQVKIDDKLLAEFIATNSINAVRDSKGFYYEVITPSAAGTSLKKGDVVSINYKISLLNGTILENNFENGHPVKFKLLNYSIIPEGLDYGVSLMKTGAKYRFYIPSYLAYGSYGIHPTPPYFPGNSNFIVEVEVVGVQTESEIESLQRDSIATYIAQNYSGAQHFANGLYFIDSIPGNGPTPFASGRIIVDFKRKYLDNSLITSKENVTIFLNMNQAVEGLEDGIKLMKEGGSAILIMPSSIGFKQSVCVIPSQARERLLRDKLIVTDVLPYSILKYVVKLKAVN